MADRDKMSGKQVNPVDSAVGTLPRVASQETIHSPSSELPKGPAADAAFTEDQVLALLKHAELPAEVLEQISKNSGVMKARKVKLALVKHPQTPRHVSLPMLRHLYTFDLMALALTPVAPADIKLAADEVLVSRLETVFSGERLALARRASGRVAGALLRDREARIVHTALENSRLTEALVVKAVTRRDSRPALVHAVCEHPKWSLRREVRIALLRNLHTPLARAIEFARSFSAGQLREILQSSSLPAATRAYLLKELAKSGSRDSRRTRVPPE